MGYFNIELPELNIENIIDILRGKEYPFFLDSGAYFKRIGEFSYWGFEPLLRFYFKDNNIYIFSNSEEKIISEEPFKFLEYITEKYKVNSTGKAFPFQGGFVGYLSYEAGRYIEDIPMQRKDDYNLPDYYFSLYDVIFVHNIKENKFYLAGYDFNGKALEKANRFFKIIKENNFNNSPNEYIEIGNNLQSNFQKNDYLEAIKKAKEYIYAGDIYQVNISQRFKVPFKGDSYLFYKHFSKLSPAPFGAFIDYSDFQILSNSPERYLFIDNDYIETRPIKGTRRRGINSEEDEKLMNELKISEKDKAEHLMIVDLERNDLGRIAAFNSVKVSEFEIIESYANVHHMVSTVEAKIDKKFNIVDCIKNSYPGGSITGAPKIRSMEIIDELEPTYRSVYTGSIGYIGFDHTIDLNIAIRTAIIKDSSIYFQVGGGIVADSDPEEEYIETIVKAESFTKSIETLNCGNETHMATCCHK